MLDRGYLLTEQCNERSRFIDRLSTAEAFDVMQAEDAGVAEAVRAAKAEICAAIDLVVTAFRRGGRLIYVGAGTSGRLGVLDAAECPPTFLTDPAQVVGIIAGGDDALRRTQEGAEDRVDDAVKAIAALDVSDRDVVMGITSGGTTPFVLAALDEARRRGAKTVFFACVDGESVADAADVNIRILVGPEIVAGSTRLKAGTATKMVLNRITTLSMIALGKVYQNLMVDVRATASEKLRDRAIRIVRSLTRLTRPDAIELLARADWHVKCAIVMQRTGTDANKARSKLAEAGGKLGQALGEVNVDADVAAGPHASPRAEQ